MPKERHALLESRKEIISSLLDNLDKVKEKLPEQSVISNAILKHHESSFQAEQSYTAPIESTEWGKYVKEFGTWYGLRVWENS